MPPVLHPAALVARYWPFPNGAGRILDRFTRSVRLGTNVTTVVTREGIALQVFADDLIGRHLIMSGRFDGSIIDVLLQHAAPEDVLLDMGANIGYVSACFMVRVAGGRAICIEPQPGVVDLLRKNMAQFGGRAAIHQVALSDSGGELRFSINMDNRGASRVSSSGETLVRAVNAADLLADLDRVDLMKIDIEGQEEVVFRTIEAELRRLKPRAILFEDATRQAGSEGTIGSILHRAGYRVSGIDKRLLGTVLVPVVTARDCRYNDYLATPNDRFCNSVANA